MDQITQQQWEEIRFFNKKGFYISIYTSPGATGFRSPGFSAGHQTGSTYDAVYYGDNINHCLLACAGYLESLEMVNAE